MCTSNCLINIKLNRSTPEEAKVHVMHDYFLLSNENLFLLALGAVYALHGLLHQPRVAWKCLVRRCKK